MCLIIEPLRNSKDLIITPNQIYRNKNMGEIVKVSLGYFSKLENCVEAIIRVDLSNRDEIIDLRGFLELYRTLKDDIESKLNL
jgi:hypothetical protein